MVAPSIVTRAAASITLADYGTYGSILLAAGEALGGYLEGDTFPCLPEAGGKFVREEEGIITTLHRQRFYRLTRCLPRKPEPPNVPLAELEAVGASLCDQQLEQLKPCHL